MRLVANRKGTSCQARPLLPKSNKGKSSMPPRFDLGSKGQVLQRSIGFEIELDYNPYWNEEHQKEVVEDKVFPLESKFPNFHKGDMIFKGDGFELQVDLAYDNFVPYLEIVTDSFDETVSGLHRLNEAMSKAMLFMEEIVNEARYHWTKFQLTRKAKSMGHLPTKFENLIYKLGGHGRLDTGSFQATSGVSLSAMNAIFDDLGEPRQDETEELREKRKSGRKTLIDWEEGVEYRKGYLHCATALKRVNEVVDKVQHEYGFGASLCGLLKIIGQYFILANEKLDSYPKSMPSILARTDFASMYRFVSTQTSDARYLEDWLAIISQMNDMLGIGPMNLPLYSKGIYNSWRAGKYYSGKQNILDVLTRERWVRKISEGKDELTERYFPDREAGKELESMGRMHDHMDDLDPLGLSKAPIFEFRDIDKRIHYTEWQSFAQAMFLWVQAKNNGQEAFFNDKKGQ
ncbi:hypothetical protein [Aureibacter tunicatorum]|uniref:Uncharacterized protein n=1 Tax=Aureibacter tunicatorum TaxID=866807 RepID=A0AAE3XKL4_9BACT|nr:hypothetical protein [Aureibacter tunicatorum]MDR6238250.1 hypothetical protein [Aureibacter tunicatorum]BDD03283.1 hypothetical protein AUTU_07660 [Aureibacter tunicatorum]